MYRVTKGEASLSATTSEYQAMARARSAGTGMLPAVVEVRRGIGDSARWVPLFMAWRGGEQLIAGACL